MVGSSGSIPIPDRSLTSDQTLSVRTSVPIALYWITRPKEGVGNKAERWAYGRRAQTKKANENEYNEMMRFHVETDMLYERGKLKDSWFSNKWDNWKLRVGGNLKTHKLAILIAELVEQEKKHKSKDWTEEFEQRCRELGI